ncbi:hypothetical protein GQ57_06485 [Burkholderia sp. MSh2]|nr:hypothetical protein GQ57_06485 [Burkholderia sp. MSh2]
MSTNADAVIFDAGFSGRRTGSSLVSNAGGFFAKSIRMPMKTRHCVLPAWCCVRNDANEGDA